MVIMWNYVELIGYFKLPGCRCPDFLNESEFRKFSTSVKLTNRNLPYGSLRKKKTAGVIISSNNTNKSQS